MSHIKWLVVLIVSAMLIGCNLPSAVAENPAQAPAAEISDPPAGTTMRWVDGSQVIVVDMDPTEGQIWITDGPITHHMYSVCVGAGQCAPADHSTEGDHGPDAPIIDPCLGVQDKEAYCAWAGGRLATDEEVIASLKNRSIGRPKYEDFTIESLAFCVIGTPHAMAPMCEMSAIVQKKQDETTASPIGKISRVADFCQGAQAYATMDIQLEGCAAITTIHSVDVHGEGTCEVTEDGRVVCYGDPQSTLEGSAMASCVSALAANAPGEDLHCPAGYTSDPENPAFCSFSFGERVHGCYDGMQVVALGGSAFVCAPPEPGESSSGESEASASAERRCIYPMCGGLSAVPDVIDSSVCLPGMYFDTELGGCVSAGPASNDCLAGFEFDQARGCCQSALPGSLYSGCPVGEAFAPATGACDPTQIFTPDGVLTPIEFSLDLPPCSGGGSAAGCQLSSAICAADGGQDFDAANCKCIPVQ